MIVQPKADKSYAAEKMSDLFMVEQKNERLQRPFFIHSFVCARNRRPITSIKSQPSRNGMASSLEKSDSTTVSQPISARKAMFSST